MNLTEPELGNIVPGALFEPVPNPLQPWSGKELLAVEHSASHFSAPESKRIQQAVTARWQSAAGGTQAQTPIIREQ